MNKRYDRMFSRLAQNREAAFIPFVMLGDPTIDKSQRIIEILIANGADALELGIPFSDPVADGPVIQRADHRALAAGVTPESCFTLLASLRRAHPELPIGLLVYANLVVHHGINGFYEMAKQSGVDSVLIADVPRQESAPFVAAAQSAGIAPVFTAPPNADENALADIARLSQGYVYFLGRAGVTGTDREMKLPQADHIAALRNAGSAPIVIGFGISTPEHVRTAIAAGASGAIAGSATVNIIEQYLETPEKMHKALAEFTKKMKEATKIS